MLRFIDRMLLIAVVAFIAYYGMNHPVVQYEVRRALGALTSEMVTERALSELQKQVVVKGGKVKITSPDTVVVSGVRVNDENAVVLASFITDLQVSLFYRGVQAQSITLGDNQIEFRF